MILNLLVAFFVVAAGATLLVCLALGLLSLSQYIESHASRARRMGLRALYTITILQLLLTLIDDVPLLPLLPNIAAAAAHYSALGAPTWPYSAPSSTAPWVGIASLLPLASHIWLVRHHTLTSHAWHQHRYDTLHRPDWDVMSSEPPGAREMSNLQVCAVLAVCVWSIPVYRLVGMIAAAEWGGAGVVEEGGRSERSRRSR
ncbi:uncharacterized protein SPSC_03636 [Sporisorium scitamineum]|uniref:Uncharacterized protein n=1 Tax=Sporisorium scitamineum TaxID=49012 RepID=A0A0F7RWY8_9BASI|nr:uncharacterized protein SPSC_03636 [Sporisorium scitamineum]CDR99207.1 hypothetical protein [Sporisorium scitamineum]